MAKQFDATMKQLLDTCAPDWARWLASRVGVRMPVTVEPLDPELSMVQPVADKVFRLGPPANGLLHLEVQSSHDASLPNRLLLYNVLLEERYGGPVRTVVLLLRREANAPALTETLIRKHENGEYLHFNYTLVRLWELEAESILSAGLGLTPMALLTDDAALRLGDVMERFAHRVESESVSVADANLMLSCAYILMGLRYDDAITRTLFQGVQKMRESSTYRGILEEGRVEGLIAARQEDLLTLLQERFQNVPPEVEQRVKQTTDPARLQTAIRRVIHIATPADLPL